MASRTSDQSWSKGSVYATSKDVINIAMSMEGSGCALIWPNILQCLWALRRKPRRISQYFISDLGFEFLTPRIQPLVLQCAVINQAAKLYLSKIGIFYAPFYVLFMYRTTDFKFQRQKYCTGTNVSLLWSFIWQWIRVIGPYAVPASTGK